MRHWSGERVCETLLGWSMRYWGGQRVCEPLMDVDPGGESSMDEETGGRWGEGGGAFSTVGSGAVPFSVVHSMAVYCLISGGWILQKMTPSRLEMKPCSSKLLTSSTMKVKLVAISFFHVMFLFSC